ncbi:MAG: UDP-glucose dehydrogenase family protein [Brevinematales bacterium]
MEYFRGKKMRIGIIGTGYVGIVSGVCFAEMRHDVVCFDVDQKKLALYRQGKSAIYEPGLEELLTKNLAAKRIRFTDVITEMLHDSDVIFLCVGTPPLPDGSADLSQVETAVREIAENTPHGAYKVIIEKSTVPVGTHKRLKNITRLYNKSQARFDFVVNSEFLKEGDAIHDFMHPDRVVIGVETDEAKNLMIQLYEPFKDRILVTDPSSAEIIKYASNSFLATKISFINMVADLCEKTGADVEEVLEGVGLDKRIGKNFLSPGVGYGGSCLPKDVKALIKTGQQLKVDMSLLESVNDINDQAKKNLLKKIFTLVKDKKITIWGLSFKPNTDDIREAPSIFIIKELLNHKFKIKAYDPEAMKNVKKIFDEKIEFFNNPYQAVVDSSAVVILTEWDEFKQIDLAKVKKLMKNNLVIDGRNIYSPSKMERLGFNYISIGRKT